MSLDLSPKLLAAFTVVAVVLIALIGWFLLVSPQRSKAETLDQQIADQRVALTEVQAAIPPPTTAKAQKATQKQLAVALPSSPEVSSLLRQVQRLAKSSNLSLESFTPTAAIPAAGYSAIPIDISVTGRYGAIRRFLKELRVNAQPTKRGGVKADGRLFAVESIGLAPNTLPELSAMIRVDAFVYSGVPAPAPVPVATTAESPDTTAVGAAP